MAIGGPENRWWWDVLENGPSSLWAGHFDVSWDPPEEKLRNTVLMPILGDHYGRVLDRGEVTLGARPRRLHDPLLRPRAAGGAAVAVAAGRGGRGPHQLRRPGLHRHRPAAAADRNPHRPAGDGRAPPRHGRAAPPAGVAARQRRPADRRGDRRRGRPGQRGRRRPPRPAGEPELPHRPLAHRRARAGLPAVLRHQHAGRAARRGPRRVRRHPRADPAVGAPGRGRRPAGRPPRRPPRPRAVPRAPGPGHRRAGGDLAGRREDPRGGRGAAGRLAGRRHHRLRPAHHDRRACSSTPTGSAR